jgi:signal transduction histidine kinase
VSGPASRTEVRSAIPSARVPWTDSRFWLLQLVVLSLALIRLAATVAFRIDTTDLVLEISTVALFVVPVVVAALHYGESGGIATVGWVAVLCIPRFVDAGDHHRTAALWAEVIQLVVLVAVAVLIGRRVSAETRFRDQADAARKARLRAELLYQDMFESNQSPILIVDADGLVVESNRSADRAFGPPADGTGDGDDSRPAAAPLVARRLVDVIGAEAAAMVLGLLVTDAGADVDDTERGTEPVGGEEPVRPVPFEVGGERLLYRPTATLVGSSGTDRRMQVIFEDVTAETKRHDLIEAYAGQVVLGQEEERRHIAQELHDGPLQALIHLCRQIDSMDGAPAAGAGAGAEHANAPSLASMRATVEETVAELRSIARGLRPSVLDDLGLVASLNQVLTDASRRQGFETSFGVEGDVRRLPSAVELAMFRIAQEAVTNVERHASARHVDLTLEFADDGLRLRVLDDGVGFDRDRRGDDGSSLGLPGMAERARLIGGQLRVWSEAGHGTVVDVRVPVGALGNS